MVINPYPGKLILLAGYDGSGKDTQARRLETVLTAQYPHIKILRPFPKEPTAGPIGRRIYDILFGRDPEFKLGVNIDVIGLQKFFIQDRIDHYKSLIIPTLESGTHIICNRGIDSTIVYGGNTITDFGRIIGLHEHMFAKAGLTLFWPDQIVIYDILPETAIRRMDNSKREKDAFENDLKARRVTSNYRALAATYPNCRLVDAEPEGSEGEKEIFISARRYIYPLLGINDWE